MKGLSIHIGDADVGVGNGHCRTTHQKLIDKAGATTRAVASGRAGIVAIQIKHRRIVDIADHQCGSVCI